MMSHRTRRLTILQINDTHGYLEPHPELVWHGRTPSFPTLGGYARIASLFKAVRLDRPNAVLVLDNGDTFHGTYPAVSSKGEALVPLANALGLDAMTAHWEFAWGPAHFQDLVTRLNYPMLAINCYQVDTGKRPFPSSHIVEHGGLRIGVIGIAATILDKTMPPQFSTGLRFTIGDEELPAEIHRLRHHLSVDLIVVLSHLGLPQDIKLAGTVGGIDVLLSGHTHDRLETPITVNGTVIIQSGCHGAFIGRLDLSVLKGEVTVESHQLIPVDDGIVADPDMQQMVDEVMAPYRATLNARVGHSTDDLHRNTIFDCPMDDLLQAAITRAAGLDIGFSNGWRYGAPIPAGPIRENDLWNIIPVNPPVSTVDLTGAEIVAMMEENLERTFSADPYGQMSGYVKRFSGMTVFAKIENPKGQRIEHLFVGDNKIDPTATYRAAFVTAQGVPARYGRNRQQLPMTAIEALRTHLATGPKPDFVAGRVICV
ncbi:MULTISPECIES: bifunctional metallophosphatase/5'-nucleotidase [unclassified Rhizobium]|jgi:sulfur-oxidizing protein SoxB|uniref:bifunctional metallophosphatase/5'-nucleotidase n=1 Tax=unclassified Rhizobium TaxID=2613769 RepID=UPI000A68BC0B|nr:MULTISPECIES: bifunctional metallophosphatase/5'-nucleotidase [unclassified Rhizobium]RKD61451.1 2',3'-cyclic-nucleotide 2'-phosphodiesterase (5'-nucleotidase family) [Rhizobium sp. WW_1]